MLGSAMKDGSIQTGLAVEDWLSIFLYLCMFLVTLQAKLLYIWRTYVQRRSSLAKCVLLERASLFGRIVA